MPKFKVRLEQVVRHYTNVEVEADNFMDACAKAQKVDDAGNADWSLDLADGPLVWPFVAAVERPADYSLNIPSQCIDIGDGSIPGLGMKIEEVRGLDSLTAKDWVAIEQKSIDQGTNDANSESRDRWL
jgi:hypothetical protein